MVARAGDGSAFADAPSELRIHATDPMLHELVLRYPDKRFATESTPELTHRCRSGARAIQFLVRILSALDGREARSARHVCRLREAAAIYCRDGIQRSLSAADSSHRAIRSARDATTILNRSRAITEAPGQSARQKADTRRF